MIGYFANYYTNEHWYDVEYWPVWALVSGSTYRDVAWDVTIPGVVSFAGTIPGNISWTGTIPGNISWNVYTWST